MPPQSGATLGYYSWPPERRAAPVAKYNAITGCPGRSVDLSGVAEAHQPRSGIRPSVAPEVTSHAELQPTTRILRRRRSARQDSLPPHLRSRRPGPRREKPPRHTRRLPRRHRTLPPRNRRRLRMHVRLVLARRPLRTRTTPLRPRPRPRHESHPRRQSQERPQGRRHPRRPAPLRLLPARLRLSQGQTRDPRPAPPKEFLRPPTRATHHPPANPQQPVQPAAVRKEADVQGQPHGGDRRTVPAPEHPTQRRVGPDRPRRLAARRSPRSRARSAEGARLRHSPRPCCFGLGPTPCSGDNVVSLMQPPQRPAGRTDYELTPMRPDREPKPTALIQPLAPCHRR